MKIALLLILFALETRIETSKLKPSQELVFFPTIGHPSAAGKSWEIEFHGYMYHPKQGPIALALLREALHYEHVTLNEAQNATLTERARLFMADHESGKKIVVRMGDKEFPINKTLPNGQFSRVVTLSNMELEALQRTGLRFQAVLPAQDSRVFSGTISLIANTGITVISDIDDTIKITQVHDRKATLRNTFLEPFKPVPGMADVYRAWSERAGAQFWYVSASPWQLYSPLAEFTRTNGFPAGVFCLKDFRLKDKSMLSLFQSPEKFKTPIIETLLQRYPGRQFVLVGDSGERDPEIYSALARRFPRQVTRIYIRNVTNQPAAAERYKVAFHGLSPELWKVFNEPSEILNGLEEAAKAEK